MMEFYKLYVFSRLNAVLRDFCIRNQEELCEI